MEHGQLHNHVKQHESTYSAGAHAKTFHHKLACESLREELKLGEQDLDEALDEADFPL